MPKGKYLQIHEKGQLDANYEESKGICEIAEKIKRSHNVV